MDKFELQDFNKRIELNTDLENIEWAMKQLENTFKKYCN